MTILNININDFGGTGGGIWKFILGYVVNLLIQLAQIWGM